MFRSKEDADTVFKHEKFPFRKCWRATKSLCNPMDQITAVRADDPKDVIWENASNSNCFRFGWQLLTGIIAFVFVMANIFALVYINSMKNNAQGGIYVLKGAGKPVEPAAFYRIQLWSLLGAFIIIFTNEIGRLVLVYFVKEQKLATQS